MILSEINEGVTRVIKVSADPDIYGQKQSEPGLAPVHMTLPGYDSSIGGSDEQPEIHTRIQG